MKAGALQSVLWAELKERSIFLAVLVLFVVVSLLDHRFCSRSNILSILGDSSYIGIAAIGMTLCIIFGAFDLSVGAMLALVSVAAVASAPTVEPVLGGLLGPWLGRALFLILVVLLGVLCGMINGMLVAFLRIPAFIATLGMMYCFRGGAFLASGGVDHRYTEAWFLQLANSDIAGVPVPFVVFLALTAAGTYLLNFHPLGRRIQAAGNSRKAARAAGYSLNKTTLAVFGLVGFFTALAAILQSSMLCGAQPGRGVEFELYVIATVVLGGTSLTGGKGSVINTLGAAVLLSALQSSFSFLEVDPYLQKSILGIVLLIVFSMRFIQTALDRLITRKKLTSGERNEAMFRSIISLIVAAALLPTLAGCKKNAGSGPSAKPVIGCSLYDMKQEFFQKMEKGTRERAVELGYEFHLHDQKSDELQMVSGCKSLLNQGVAALIVSPCKPDALGAVVEAARKTDVPVVIDDIGGGGTDYSVIVISDNFGGGKLAGQFLIDKLGPGKGRPVAIIKVEPSAVYAVRRGEGFKKAVTDNGFAVVAELSGHSQTEEGYSKMKNIMAGNPDLVAVFCENDPMAVGAAQAVAESDKKGQILVIGFNADDVALASIKAGTMAATVAQSPESMGRITAELANQLIKKRPLKFDDPLKREIFAPVKLVTAANLPK